MASASDSEPFFLPPPRPDQNYVTISALTGGFITLSDKFFVHPADPNGKRTVPSLCFLVTHPTASKTVLDPSAKSAAPYRLVFDLGLRSRIERYSPHLQKHLDGRRPYKLAPGVAEQLVAGGASPNDIDAVMLSHVHYDHHGDPEDFPNSTFIVGHGALDVLAHGLQGKGNHQHFEPQLLSKHKVIELPSPHSPKSSVGTNATDNPQWKPLGPFPSSLDLFNDGSVYILDVPGHLPGHVNLLCRVGPERWICLCGDAFHDPRLLTGEKEIGTWHDDAGTEFCIHLDKEAAAESIRRLRRLKEGSGGMSVELVAAHDEAWLEGHQQGLFPGTL